VSDGEKSTIVRKRKKNVKGKEKTPLGKGGAKKTQKKKPRNRGGLTTG